MITSWHSTASRNDYLVLRYNKIVLLEGSEENPYLDTHGIPTIGVGFNLRTDSVRQAVFKAMRIDVSQISITNTAARIAEQGYIDQLTAATLASYTNNTALQDALHNILIQRSLDPLLLAFPHITDRIFFSMQPVEIRTVFDKITDTIYEKTVETWLPDVPDSNERLVLLSLAYNGVIGINSNETFKSPALRQAIIEGNRAEAWYQIRYTYNPGLAKNTKDAWGVDVRRAQEADLFGLYDGASGQPTTQEEAINVIRVLRQHLDGINTYEDYLQVLAKAPHRTTPTLHDQYLSPAIGYLITHLGLQTLEDVQIAIQRSLSFDYVNGSSKNELILGNSQRNSLNGGAGNDLLRGHREYTQETDDILNGGPGDDILIGGWGYDTYSLDITDIGTDIIYDDNGRIFLGDVLLAGGKKTSTNALYYEGQNVHYLLAADTLKIMSTQDDRTYAILPHFTNRLLGIVLQDENENEILNPTEHDHAFDNDPILNTRPQADPNPSPAPVIPRPDPPPLPIPHPTPPDPVTPTSPKPPAPPTVIPRTPPTYRDPIILDLNGDGVQTKPLDYTVWFDHQNTGFLTATGWVDPTDALLVMDRNGNGLIDNGSELFGDSTPLLDGTLATNGYQALATWDSNGDWIIGPLDQAYTQLKLWQDRNQDGISQPDELTTLSDATIASLALLNLPDWSIDSAGNLQAQTSTFTWTDGQQGITADFWLNSDPLWTRMANPAPIPASIAALPLVPGQRQLPDLHQAMIQDPLLTTLVTQFTTSSDPTARPILANEILLRWTQSNGIDPTSRGSLVDAQHVHAIERLYEKQYSETIPLADVHQVENSYESTLAYVQAMLTAQSHLSEPFWVLADAEPNLDQTGYRDFQAATAYFEYHLADPTTRVEVQQQLIDFVTTLRGLMLDGTPGFIEFRYALLSRHPELMDAIDRTGRIIHEGTSGGDFLVLDGGDHYTMLKSNMISAGDGDDTIGVAGRTSTVYAGAGNDLVYGFVGSDTLDGGPGDDHLIGGGGSDIYGPFGNGSGHDSITNLHLNPDDSSWVLMAPGVTAQEVIATRLPENHLQLTITTPNAIDTVTITSYFDGDGYGVSAIPTIAFDDGTRWSIDDIRYLVTQGTPGSDYLEGFSDSDDILDGQLGDDILIGQAGNDHLTGGQGNDLLTGGSGVDTFSFGIGDGNDHIQDRLSEVGVDTILFGSGIVPTNLSITRTGDGLSIAYTPNDTVQIDSFFAGYNSIAIAFQVDPTTVWTMSDLRTMALVNAQTDGNDLIEGYETDDTILGRLGDDTIAGLDGNDLLNGGEGNDSLNGGTGHDQLIGGLGNDQLMGGQDGDTYIVDQNSGNDTIYDADPTPGAIDSLNITTGTLPTDVGLRRINDDLLVTISSQGIPTATVTVLQQFDDFAGQGIGIEQIVFDDGTLWDLSTIHTKVLEATSGDDLLRGFQSNDTIHGFDGNDHLWGHTGNDTLFGDAGNDHLYGEVGDDLLNGGTGDDWLQGDSGSDTYQMARGLGHDTIFEQPYIHGFDDLNTLAFTDVSIRPEDVFMTRVGNDLLLTLVTPTTTTITQDADTIRLAGFYDPSWTIGAEIDRVTFADTAQTIWTAADLRANAGTIVTGGLSSDSLTGTDGMDWLAGGAGADVMAGYDGNDTYIVDNVGDQVIEQVNQGTDQIRTDVTYTLPANTEYLLLIGTDPITGIGNELHNILDASSNPAANLLYGLNGNDTYVVGQGDVAIENSSSGGHDTVVSAVSYALGNNLEDIILTGSDPIQGTGNTLDNLLDGTQSLASNILIGATGNDTFVLGFDDIAIENPNEGALDTVYASFSTTLSANVERLILTGTDPINGTGNTLDNWLYGNSADNILDGWSGTDAMYGGVGNDTYYYNSTFDYAYENTNEGTDTIYSNINTFLPNNVEILRLTDITNLQGTGNTLNNTLYGNSGSNRLDGGSGIDTMIGGTGDDYYTLDQPNDVIIEQSNEGYDSASVAFTYTLPDHVEALSLNGYTPMNGYGNTLNNSLGGNYSDNLLDGGIGADSMSGGYSGNDTFIVDDPGDLVIEPTNWAGIDTVMSSLSYTLPTNLETLVLLGTNPINGTGNTLDNTLTGNDEANVLTGGAGNDTYYVGTGDSIVEIANGGTDIVYSTSSYALDLNVESLTLIGALSINGTGNPSDNILTGNEAPNLLAGGGGNDTYYVSLGDTVIEQVNEGYADIIYSPVSYTLSANIEKLTLIGTDPIEGTGNALNNTFVGNSAANLFAGGAGSDSYYLGAGDQAIELLNDGTDSIYSTADIAIGQNIENLYLTGTLTTIGTANALGNNLFGSTNYGASAMANTLLGAQGNDTYYVDSNDLVIENPNEGNDQVYATGSFTLGPNIEYLALSGAPSTAVATGNELANRLNGSYATQRLEGRSGDDIYWVGLGAQVVENDNEGIDLIYADSYYFPNQTYILSANVEQLTLTGTGTIHGTGNVLDNLITGNAGNNTLSGLAGNDTLIGNGGSDTLSGGQGDDALLGGTGNDLYAMALGDEHDTITEYDTTPGNADKLQYGAGINPIDLVFAQLNNQLQVTNHQTADQVTIQNWYGGSANQIETIQAGNGQTLMNTQVAQLIQDMATFCNQNSLTWDQAIDSRPTDVATVLAGNWQPTPTP